MIQEALKDLAKGDMVTMELTKENRIVPVSRWPWAWWLKLIMRVHDGPGLPPTAWTSPRVSG